MTLFRSTNVDKFFFLEPKLIECISIQNPCCIFLPHFKVVRKNPVYTTKIRLGLGILDNGYISISSTTPEFWCSLTFSLNHSLFIDRAIRCIEK